VLILLQTSTSPGYDEAMVAIEFMAEAPYYEVVWIYQEDEATPRLARNMIPIDTSVGAVPTPSPGMLPCKSPTQLGDLALRWLCVVTGLSTDFL